jgi:NADH-quinone oxidoreductase subunit A
VAITFLVFDVELLFLYPWAVASRNPAGIDAAVVNGVIASRGMVFGGAMVFIALLALGFIYDWRKGVFRWR